MPTEDGARFVEIPISGFLSEGTVKLLRAERKDGNDHLFRHILKGLANAEDVYREELRKLVEMTDEELEERLNAKRVLP